MRLQSLSGRMVTSAAALIFILVISNSLAQAKDNKPSPLFRESLQETVKEFDNGTVKITKVTAGRHDQVKIVKVKVDVDRDHDCKIIDELKDHIKNGCPVYPTLRGSTCRGVRCNGFPTLVGSTCSVTCGTRSTCSNGRFCRNHPSPCAKADSPDRLAEGNEQPFTFTVF